MTNKDIAESIKCLRKDIDDLINVAIPDFSELIANVGTLNTSTYTNSFYSAGDSITAGVAAEPRSVYAFTHLISSALRLIEVNSAISGTTLVKFNNGDNSGIDRLATITPTYASTMQAYLLGYGTNDVNSIGGPYNATNFRNAYYTFIDTLVGKGWPLNKIILWVPFNGSTSSGILNALVQDIATVKGVVFMNIWQYMSDKGGMSLINADTLHPTTQGHIIIAEAFLNFNTTIPEYPYSIFNQDVLSTGKLYAGKGIYGGSQADGLELYGTNDVNFQGKITSMVKHFFKKSIAFDNPEALTPPNGTIDFGGLAYTSGSSSYANAFIKWYSALTGTYIGVSVSDGLTLGSSAGGGAGAITLKSATRIDDNVTIGQNATGLQTTPKRIKVDSYIAGAVTNLNTIFQMFGGAGIGASSSEGIVITAVGSGLQQRITLKNDTYIIELLDLGKNLKVGSGIANTASTSPATIDTGGSYSSVPGKSLKLKLYNNQVGIGVSNSSMDLRTFGVFSFYNDESDTKIAEIGVNGIKANIFNLPVIAAPSSPIDGYMWREDNTNTGFKIRIGGVTKTIALV